MTGDIHQIRKEIEQIAKDYGLNFFETIFELLDSKELNEIASYGGFPTRYPHWRFGMEFDHLCKGYEYGLQKIYEMVINHDPCYAYLMRANSIVDQKIVIAHVYAHSDFFKNNETFKHTNRKMIDQMANHAVKIRAYEERFGVDVVENFIDACLSLENLVDTYRPYQFSKPMPASYKEKDILGFLIEYAPLNEWQKEVLLMIREEMFYFLPQAQTKIMNEGWASFWHSKILTEKILKDSEVIDFADRHAATLASTVGQLNPYKLGIEIFRDVEERHGREKIFEVRRFFHDVTFIDEFLTPELCEKQKLFTYAYNKRNNTYEIVDRDYRKVKEKLLFSLTNFGHPFIYVTDHNFEGKGNLLLHHEHEGVDLKLTDTKETLERIQKIWKKAVYLETIINGEKRLLIFNGQEHHERALS